MKKLTYLVVLIMSTSILFTSCNKEDKNNNQFTFDGATLSLDKGYIKDLDKNGDGSYKYGIYLMSENVMYVGKGDIEGIGHLIYFELNSPNAEGLDEGTYPWSLADKAFTYFVGSIIIDADFELETGNEFVLLNGTIDISKEAGENVLEFEMPSTGNKKISGYFKGGLEKVN